MSDRYPDEQRPVDLGEELEPVAPPPTIDPDERIEEFDDAERVEVDPESPDDA